MRIIGGTAGGTILKVPAGLGVRPTPDRVRQAIFNSLGGAVVDADVLELFGGTGALSLEAVSRGATSALCVEKSSKHAGFIRRNCTAAKLPQERFSVRVGDVFAVLPQLAAADHRFDLVFADPPFGEKNVGHRSKSMSQRLLDSIDLPELIEPENGLLILGHAKRDVVTVTPVWEEHKVMNHGDSVFRFLAPAGA